MTKRSARFTLALWEFAIVGMVAVSFNIRTALWTAIGIYLLGAFGECAKGDERE